MITYIAVPAFLTLAMFGFLISWAHLIASVVNDLRRGEQAPLTRVQADERDA